MSSQQRANPPLPKKFPFMYRLHESSSKLRSSMINRFQCAIYHFGLRSGCCAVINTQNQRYNLVIKIKKSQPPYAFIFIQNYSLLISINAQSLMDTHLQILMYTKLLCIFVSLLILTQSKPFKANRIIKAINCGLKEGSTKGDGDLKYENDAALVTGSSVDVDYHSDSGATGTDIKFTLEKEIYMFQRHTYSQMTYSIPVKTGKHTLILKFAEMYFQKAGERVFDIKIGDNVVIANMDVIEKTGAKYAAHEEYLEFEIKNAAVYIGQTKIKNGLKDGNIQLTFVKGKADNPIIQAIIMYQGPVQQTPKQQYESLKKNWGSHQQMIKAKKENEKIKQMISMTKKKQRIIIRNDQLLIEEEQGKAQSGPRTQKFGTIRSFLMGPIGILIWTAVILYKIYFVYTKIFLMNKQSVEISKSD